jgi:hypothetical protein
MVPQCGQVDGFIGFTLAARRLFQARNSSCFRATLPQQSHGFDGDAAKVE